MVLFLALAISRTNYCISIVRGDDSMYKRNKAIIDNDGNMYKEREKVLVGMTGYDKDKKRLVVGCPYCKGEHSHSVKSAGELRKCAATGRNYVVQRVVEILD